MNKRSYSELEFIDRLTQILFDVIDFGPHYKTITTKKKR